MAATANMGRPRKPTHLRLAQGDPGHRPVSPDIELPAGEPTKPEHFTAGGHASELWDLIVGQMREHKLLKPIHAATLEAMCETFDRWRTAVEQRHAHGLTHEGSQGTSAAPWVGIEERASKEFRAWAAEYGITPATAKNLGTPAESGDASPFG